MANLEPKQQPDAHALKLKGNELYRTRDYRGAIHKYDEALGGAESTGNGMKMGIQQALCLNRAACYLEIADRMRGFGDERAGAYTAAARDAGNAARTTRLLGGDAQAKALFRLGRAELGLQTLRAAQLDQIEGGRPRDRSAAATLLEARRAVAKQVEICTLSLRSASELSPGDAMIRAKLQEAERLAAALGLVGAPPTAQAPIPAPALSRFAQGVSFTEGVNRVANRVALELPIVPSLGKVVMLPVYLSKQINDHNQGELCIWIHYSDHLSASVLTERGAAIGLDTEFEGAAGEPWGNLSTPAQGKGDIESRDEFVLALDFSRRENTYSARIPDTLVAANVIERVRGAGQTQFGENFVIYRALF